MAGTQTSSVRSTAVVAGTNKYIIVTTCTVAGTLPDANIFLLSIVTPDDPKDDTLVRVVAVADITEYLTNRDAAVTAGSPFWRSQAVTLRFDDIETANAAWKELESRINKFVTQVDEYDSEFSTTGSGDVTVYPTADQSEKNARLAAYEATATPITDAEDARDTGQAACTQLTRDLAVTEDRLQEANADLTLYLQIQASVGGVNSSMPSIETTISTANAQARAETGASAASTGEKTGIEVQHAAVDTQLTLFTVQNTALNTVQTGSVTTAVSTLQSRVTTLTTSKSTLLTQLNTCNAAVASLEATVDATRTARETALADVIAVCPGFTP